MVKQRLRTTVLFCFVCFWQQAISQTPAISDLEFGKITVNGIDYEDDILIDHGKVKNRKKKESKALREQYGHTPLTELENIPWDCDTLVIGIGMSGRLPVTDSLKKEAEKRKVVLILLQTPEAVTYFQEHYGKRTNAVFHITC